MSKKPEEEGNPTHTELRGEKKIKAHEKRMELLSKRNRVCPDCSIIVEYINGDYLIEVQKQTKLKKPGAKGGKPPERCRECQRKRNLKKDADRKKEAYYKEKQKYEDCVHRDECEYGVSGCESCLDYESPV